MNSSIEQSDINHYRKTYIVKDDLHYINEFWGQTLVAIPAPIQAKLEMFDPEGSDSVSSLILNVFFRNRMWTYLVGL